MKVKTVQDFNNVDNWEDLRKYSSQVVKAIIDVVNGNLDFSSNIRSSIITAQFTVATSDQQVAHGLGTVPSGYIVVGRSSNFNVFNGISPNTSDNIFLASSGAGTATILVF